MTQYLGLTYTAHVNSRTPEPAAELWQRVVPFLAHHLEGA